MIAVRFTADRGSRREGDVVRYDDASAVRIVGEGVAEFVDDVPSAAEFFGDALPTSEFTPPDGFTLASAEDGD
ncbi:hypothetical protein LK459_11655 [Gordonia otitidis]|uniref:hypothetical protein n=1 Tax=Gordonia otitidis TaxID=249058 RepID=UPI001D13AC06|nr:hypothetical protein [Gordonia otitidis]UEA57303.1 hypothetical protein LK459_11655 [Gordonia otitidis]